MATLDFATTRPLVCPNLYVVREAVPTFVEVLKDNDWFAVLPVEPLILTLVKGSVIDNKMAGLSNPGGLAPKLREHLLLYTAV